MMSDSLSGTFRNIADGHGHGEDHCELVGGSDTRSNLPSNFWTSPATNGRTTWHINTKQSPRVRLVLAQRHRRLNNLKAALCQSQPWITENRTNLPNNFWSTQPTNNKKT